MIAIREKDKEIIDSFEKVKGNLYLQIIEVKNCREIRHTIWHVFGGYEGDSCARFFFEVLSNFISAFFSGVFYGVSSEQIFSHFHFFIIFFRRFHTISRVYWGFIRVFFKGYFRYFLFSSRFLSGQKLIYPLVGISRLIQVLSDFFRLFLRFKIFSLSMIGSMSV